MSDQAALSAASNARKARLAQLKSLKRKDESTSTAAPQAIEEGSVSLKRKSRSPSPPASSAILSGRNYDAELRGPKLGFENAPTQGQSTIEAQAKRLADETREQQKQEEASDAQLDLFKLQPKRPNWDLKRDLAKKLEILDVRTNNAIARLVRERIQKAQKQSLQSGDVSEADAVGMEGNALVEAMHMREREIDAENLEAADEDSDGEPMPG